MLRDSTEALPSVVTSEYWQSRSTFRSWAFVFVHLIGGGKTKVPECGGLFLSWVGIIIVHMAPSHVLCDLAEYLIQNSERYLRKRLQSEYKEGTVPTFTLTGCRRCSIIP